MSQFQNLLQQQSLASLLKNDRIVSFVATLTKDSYRSYFRGHEDEVNTMIDQAWELLVSESRIDANTLRTATITINEKIFQKNVPSFWFNVMYQEYKAVLRPPRDFQGIRPLLKGTRVLDFGSGGGYLANII